MCMSTGLGWAGLGWAVSAWSPAIRRRSAAPLCIARAVSLDPGWISLERVLIALQRRESGCGDGREETRTAIV